MDAKRKESIGKRMQQQRELTGLSQEKLSEKIDLSKMYYSSLERGVRAPSLDTFIDILNAIEIPADIVLADVLKVGYKIKATRLGELVENAPPEKREQIFTVVEAMLKDQN